MRRGHRNRWSYDQSPKGDGLVTIPQSGNVQNFANVETLAQRDKAPATIKLLQKYGWLPK